MKTIPLVLCLCTTQLTASILQDQEYYTGVFGAPWSFKGQSFLADQPFLNSIGVRLQLFSPSQSDPTVNLSLFGGRGIDGPLIAQRSLTPSLTLQPWDVIWLDFDLAGVQVQPGETYTFTISAPTLYWGAKYNQWAFPNRLNPEAWEGRIDYPGGEYLDSRGFVEVLDLTFRVDTIPEPSIAVLFLAGLAGLWFWRRL